VSRSALVGATVGLASAFAACPRPPAADLVAHPEPDLVGVTHVVKPGETLWRIAKAYDVDPAELAEVNGISDPTQITAGAELFIPGALAVQDVPPGRNEAPPHPPLPAPALGRLAWPLVGVLYARFGKRGPEFHDGIDLAAPEGTLVHAAGSGEVLFAGEERGYGNIVILQHEHGLVSIYAHNKENRVKAGDKVAQGQVVATVGQSGQTTGPHLHFEVRENGQPRDPLGYLPRPR
jgi:lipoprotein NlpD